MHWRKFEESLHNIIQKTVLFVMIILFFTFQLADLLVLLVLTIQGSIWINFAVSSIEEQTVFFIAYLIVSA